MLYIQSYLRQLDQPQVAFSVKQRQPKTLDEAVAATLEMESYAVTSPIAGIIATFQEEGKSAQEEESDGATVASINPTVKLTTMVEKLLDRVETLERRQTEPANERRPLRRSRSYAQPRGSRQHRVCWTCQLPGHIARNCPQGN